MKHEIINLQVLAILVCEQNTGQVILDTAAKALDVLSPSWRDINIGVLTGVEKKMKGRISHIATRLCNATKLGFIKIWCGAHQLELVPQDECCELGSDTFYTQVNSLTLYLW